MIRYLPFLLLVPALTFGNPSPDSLSNTLLEKSVFRLSFLGIGPMYEHRISPRGTLVARAGLTGGLTSTASNAQGIMIDYYFSPIISLSARHYYNLEKRIQKNYTTRYNSGNYYAFRVQQLLSPLLERRREGSDLTVREGTALSLLWGMQRTYPKGMFFNMDLGGGLLFDRRNRKAVVFPAIELTVGYTFPGRGRSWKSQSR